MSVLFWHTTILPPVMLVSGMGADSTAGLAKTTIGLPAILLPTDDVGNIKVSAPCGIIREYEAAADLIVGLELQSALTSSTHQFQVQFAGRRGGDDGVDIVFNAVVAQFTETAFPGSANEIQRVQVTVPASSNARNNLQAGDSLFLLLSLLPKGGRPDDDFYLRSLEVYQ